MQEWLARSGSRPLSLEFISYYHSAPVLNEFLKVIYPHFPRLTVLRFGLDGGLQGDILPIPRVDMPWC